MKLDLILEKGDGGDLWGRIEDKGNYLPTTVADDVKGVEANMRMLIADYLAHEGKEDKFWKKINPETVEFNLYFDLQAFFEEFDFLKISNIAKAAGVNEGLLRQYASGVKYPSTERAKLIQDVIHALADKMKAANIYAE